MLSLNAQSYFAEREEDRLSFVRKHAGSDFVMRLVAEDWASRRYFRLEKDGQTFILMEAVPDHTGQFTPGHKLSDYIRINMALASNDVRVPKIFAADDMKGYLLLEDFGDTSVYAALARGDDALDLYTRATDALIRMQSGMEGMKIDLPDYYQGHVHKGRQRLVDWYIPATRKERNPDGLVESYLAVWDEIEKTCSPKHTAFVHGDYHMQNLMLLKDGGIGVLDFQGGMWGPDVYDLGNLLEDIRCDVPDSVRQAMLDRFFKGRDGREFYRILTTQFHCRILGQVLRLAIAGNRTNMMQFMPRVQQYLVQALKDPVLEPLKKWMEAGKVDLTVANFNSDEIRPFIRDDAF